MLYYYIHFSLVNPENLPGLIFEILILIRRVVAWMYLCSISSFPIRFKSVKLAFENWGDLLKNPRLSLSRGRTAIWLKNVQFFFHNVFTHILSYKQTLPLGFKSIGWCVDIILKLGKGHGSPSILHPLNRWLYINIRVFVFL